MLSYPGLCTYDGVTSRVVAGVLRQWAWRRRWFFGYLGNPPSIPPPPWLLVHAPWAALRGTSRRRAFLHTHTQTHTHTQFSFSSRVTLSAFRKHLLRLIARRGNCAVPTVGSVHLSCWGCVVDFTGLNFSDGLSHKCLEISTPNLFTQLLHAYLLFL